MSKPEKLLLCLLIIFVGISSSPRIGAWGGFISLIVACLITGLFIEYKE